MTFDTKVGAASKVPAFHGKMPSMGQKPFGQMGEAPDSYGPLRKARQMLAGTATAIRTKTPHVAAKAPHMKVKL